MKIRLFKPSPDVGLIGYCEYLEGKVVKYGTEVTNADYYNAEQHLEKDAFKKRIAADFGLIKQAYDAYYCRGYY